MPILQRRVHHRRAGDRVGDRDVVLGARTDCGVRPGWNGGLGLLRPSVGGARCGRGLGPGAGRRDGCHRRGASDHPDGPSGGRRVLGDTTTPAATPALRVAAGAVLGWYGSAVGEGRAGLQQGLEVAEHPGVSAAGAVLLLGATEDRRELRRAVQLMGKGQ